MCSELQGTADLPFQRPFLPAKLALYRVYKTNRAIYINILGVYSFSNISETHLKHRFQHNVNNKIEIAVLLNPVSPDLVLSSVHMLRDLNFNEKNSFILIEKGNKLSLSVPFFVFKVDRGLLFMVS